MSSDFGPWFGLAIRGSSSEKELNSLRFLHADFGSNHFFGRALQSVETQESNMAAKKIDLGVLNIVVWSIWGSPNFFRCEQIPGIMIRCSDQMHL